MLVKRFVNSYLVKQKLLALIKEDKNFLRLILPDYVDNDIIKTVIERYGVGSAFELINYQALKGYPDIINVIKNIDLKSIKQKESINFYSFLLNAKKIISYFLKNKIIAGDEDEVLFLSLLEKINQETIKNNVSHYDLEQDIKEKYKNVPIEKVTIDEIIECPRALMYLEYTLTDPASAKHDRDTVLNTLKSIIKQKPNCLAYIQWKSIAPDDIQMLGDFALQINSMTFQCLPLNYNLSFEKAMAHKEGIKFLGDQRLKDLIASVTDEQAKEMIQEVPDIGKRLYFFSEGIRGSVDVIRMILQKCPGNLRYINTDCLLEEENADLLKAVICANGDVLIKIPEHKRDFAMCEWAVNSNIPLSDLSAIPKEYRNFFCESFLKKAPFSLRDLEPEEREPHLCLIALRAIGNTQQQDFNVFIKNIPVSCFEDPAFLDEAQKIYFAVLAKNSDCCFLETNPLIKSMGELNFALKCLEVNSLSFRFIKEWDVVKKAFKENREFCLKAIKLSPLCIFRINPALIDEDFIEKAESSYGKNPFAFFKGNVNSTPSYGPNQRIFPGDIQIQHKKS